MKNQIVLISCVSKKLSKKSIARSLYVSPLFKLNLQYAEKLKPDHIFILSAKHGLLTLDQEIEPYEQTLNSMPAKEIKGWANKVIGQIKKCCDVNETEFVFLAGHKYRKYLIPEMPNVQIPLKGLGIGKQLQRLKILIDQYN